ncbi:MAG: hypothetical protein LBI59_12205 [Candidatus Accumulibacter sp.]|jgi:hypothetical protein|nr:hypothetical protein [Accumulibacter sp.]
MSARNADNKQKNPTPSKRRSFLATRQDEALEAKALQIKTELVDASPDKIPNEGKDDDIPVLTEVIPAGGKDRETEDAGISPPDPPSDLSADAEVLAKQMVEAIERQLTYELPTLVEASLLNISADLHSGIASTMQTALKEFIAHRKKR